MSLRWLHGNICVKSCCFNGIAHQTCAYYTIPRSRNQACSSNCMPEFVFAAIWQMCIMYIGIYTSPVRYPQQRSNFASSYVACIRWITLIIYLYKDIGRLAQHTEWYKHICNFSCNNLFAYHTQQISTTCCCAVAMGEMLAAVQYLRSSIWDPYILFETRVLVMLI